MREGGEKIFMSNMTKKWKQLLALFIAMLLLFGSVPLEPVLISAGELESIGEDLDLDEIDIDLLEQEAENEVDLEGDYEPDVSETEDTSPVDGEDNSYEPDISEEEEELPINEEDNSYEPDISEGEEELPVDEEDDSYESESSEGEDEDELFVGAAQFELFEPLSGAATSEVRLHWLANSNNDHLTLNPPSNTTQTHIMELNLSLRSGNDYGVREIEIRLPRALFEDRNGNLITNPPISVPLPGPTSFNYVIDTATQEIVITNFEPVTAGTHFRVQFSVRYLPSQSPNGYRNDNITARVTFAGRLGIAPLQSNNLSLDLTTRVNPLNTTKTVSRSYSVWQNRWGARPDDAANYFYVRYRIFHGASPSTQPFTVHLTETPLDSGEIVAWSNIDSSPTFLTSWALGNTTQFNEQAARTWNVTNPSGSSVSRWQDIIVRYPRLGDPDQVVRNRVEVVFTPIDNERDPEANPITSILCHLKLYKITG